MAETRTVNLEIKDNVKSLKTQYKEAVQEVQRLADAYGATSTEAANAAKKAAELKDRIEESKSLTDAFNPDAKFNALSGAIGGVLNGFQAYEGAMGLIGVESEDLQKTLLKVQSAMALSQGIQGALEAKDAFVNLGAVVKNAFVGMTTASKAFAATGIGLLVTGIALAVSKLQELNDTEKEFKKLEESRLNQKKEMIELEKAENKELATQTSSFVSLVSQLKNTNQNTKERKTLIDQINTQYGTTLKNMSSELDFQAQLNQAVADYITFQGLKIRQQQNEAQVTKIIEKQIELSKKAKGLLGINEDDLTTFDLGKFMQGQTAIAKSELDKIVALNGSFGQELVDEYNQVAIEAGVLNQDLQSLGMTSVDLTAELNKYVYQVGKGAQNSTKERANYARQLEKELIDAMEDGMEKRLALLKFNEEGEIAGIDKKGKKAGELIKAIETRYEGERNKVKEEFRVRRDRDEDVSLEKRPVKRLEIGKQEIDAESYVQSELLRLEQEADDKRKANTIQRTDQILKAAQTFTQVYSSLNGLLNASDNERLKKVEKGSKEEQKIKKRMFNRDKALRISQTIVDTASNIVTSVRNGGGIPTGIPFGIAAGAMGALQIAAIAKAKYDGGETPSDSGGGDVASGGGASTTPQFNTIGSSGVNQLAQLQQQPVQAYVVSGDVTSAQSLDRNRIQNATL